MRSIGIMQPYFLPYIGYFQLINEVDKYIIYSNLTFIKDGWMNRNRILLKNGEISTISIPLLKKSSNSSIIDVQIDNSQYWKKKMIKSFFLNYKGSEYFDEFFPYFENLLNEPFDSLSDFNSHLIVELSRYIGIDTNIEQSNFQKYGAMEEKLLSTENDNYHNFPYMKKTKPIAKVARVLEICKNEDAEQFVNAIGGQSLYSKEEFKQYGINLNFIKTAEFKYNQFSFTFHPNLSIVDVLMHNGKEGTLNFIKKYKLV